MSIVDFFKRSAASAGQTLSDLANQKRATGDKQRALDNIEAYFDQMAADGVLDPEEMARLRGLLGAEGMDATSLDALYAALQDEHGTVTTKEAGSLTDEMRHMLSGARVDATDDEALMTFQIQEAANEYTLALNAASTLSKKEHDAYMAVIRNMGG